LAIFGYSLILRLISNYAHSKKYTYQNEKKKRNKKIYLLIDKGDKNGLSRDFIVVRFIVKGFENLKNKSE
jgi:hypothetical protein